MVYTLIAALVGTTTLSAVLVPVVIRLARHFGAVKTSHRVQDIHIQPTPEWGGVAIYVAIATVISICTWVYPVIIAPGLPGIAILGMLLGGFVLVVGGVFDDRYDWSPERQLLVSLIAVAVVVITGIGPEKITNPWGGIIYLSGWMTGVLTFVWMMGMIYTTKFLDGIDGLVSGVTVIGSVVITCFTLITRWYQPNVGLMAAIVAGAFFGFLIWNWHPAKIFLGNGGSMLAGFMLGVLSIISGGKIAIALLVMGLPILDVGWVIIRRIFIEKRSWAASDRKHLHHRLLDAGFSVRQAALFYYAVSAIFGISALILQSRGKLYALGTLTFFMIGLGSYLVVRLRRRSQKHRV